MATPVHRVLSPDSLPYSRREQRGWYFYDWANSAFSTTSVTLFLGPYLTALAKAGASSDGYIAPLGIRVDPRAYWGYLVALSVLLQVIVLPLFGALADAGHRKKRLLALSAYAGALPAAAMFFLRDGSYLWGGVLFVVANVSLGASSVVYNAFLPEIAAPEDRDQVSSRGWGMGYLGGGLLLALNLILFLKAPAFGLTEAQAVRISLGSAGVWWAVFTLIPLAALRDRLPARRLAPDQAPHTSGFRQLFATLHDLRRYPKTVTFLLAYLLYNDAIQAVIALASQFGNDELHIPMATMTLVILMVQFVAFFGAFGFDYVARAIGAKRAVMAALVLWTAVLVAIYGAVRTTAQFFVAAAVVAVIMGGSQALSRSLYSQMIPKGREAEYFSLYEISDKGTSWMCPLLFGLALQFTHSYRLAILSLVVFFLAGLLMLARVDVARAAREAGN
ncbi:MAG TPA: MFS transporter [Bryobacteraceae bacterium]|nr:MFS transporter [Bryobacteraceae bacterium]